VLVRPTGKEKTNPTNGIRGASGGRSCPFRLGFLGAFYFGVLNLLLCWRVELFDRFSVPENQSKALWGFALRRGVSDGEGASAAPSTLRKGFHPLTLFFRLSLYGGEKSAHPTPQEVYQ